MLRELNADEHGYPGGMLEMLALSRTWSAVLQSVRFRQLGEESAVVGGSAERAEGVPSGSQPVESDPSQGTSANIGPVDMHPAGTALAPRTSAEIAPTGAKPEEIQAADGKPPESPQNGPRTPAEVIAAIEGHLFRSLLGRGLIVSLIPHYRYRLMRQLSRDSDKSYSDIHLLPVPGLRWLCWRVEAQGDFAIVSMPSLRILEKIIRRQLRVRLKFDEGRALLLRALVILSKVLAAGLTIIFVSPYYIVWAGLRALSATFRLALTATPILLAILVVVFTTGDAWRLYGDEPLLRFGALTLVILVVAVLALYRVVVDQGGGWRHMVATMAQRKSMRPELVVKTKAADLADAGVTPTDITHDGLWKLHRYNVYVLFWLTIFGQLVAVALWISLMFIILGAIIVTKSAASELLMGQPDVLWKFSILGQNFMVSQQLVLLSVTLGAVAALTFATLGLQDKNSRQDFFDRSLADLRQGLAMLSYYIGGVNDSEDMLSEEDRRIMLAMITIPTLILMP
jgi:hypothetical protein